MSDGRERRIDDLKAEIDALNEEVMAIAEKTLPKTFGVDVPLQRLLDILREMQARMEALEKQAQRPSSDT